MEIEDIDFNNIVKTTFNVDSDPTSLLRFGEIITIEYKSGKIEGITPYTIYPEKEIPSSEIYKILKIDREGRPIKNKTSDKEILKYYNPVKNIPTVRKNDELFLLNKNSTWRQDESNKRKEKWDIFCSEFKQKYNKSKAKIIEDLRIDFQEKRKELENIEDNITELLESY